jgi:DNA ligase 1
MSDMVLEAGSFDRFAQTCDRIVSYSGRLKKVALLAELLQHLDDDDFGSVIRFLADGPVPKQDGRRLSLGHSALRASAIQLTGLDLDIFRACHQTVGDTSETISMLLAASPVGSDWKPLELHEAADLYQHLFRIRHKESQVQILAESIGRWRPLTVKYFLKVITGSFRIGLQEKMVEEAVASALNRPIDEIRSANHRSGDLAAVGVAARNGTLGELKAKLFHPIEMMLAKPLDQIADVDLTDGTWVWEDKYDGIRSQLHVENGEVRIFTRGLDDVTGGYPEIVAAAARLSGSAVFDGELLGWKDGRALPFTLLQQRLARKKVSKELRDQVPVIFMAYDLLFRDGVFVLDRPLAERRQLLEAAVRDSSEKLFISPQFPVTSLGQVETAFDSARLRGNEGLLLKRRDSLYECGKRSGFWLKLKRPFATLDVVITAAEQGSGKRASVLSDYTFAIKTGDRFVNIGKAYSGLTDMEIKELTKLLRALVVERFQRVFLVEPKIVLEVAFDGIQKSARHKSGFALRFPRILRWRQDKRPDEVDTLETVQQLYERSLQLPPQLPPTEATDEAVTA